MTDQQLAEAPDSIVIDEAQTEYLPSETVSDTGENQEQKLEVSPEQKAAAEQAFKAREAKREAQALREENARLKAQMPEETRPNVPELDEYADAEQLKKWQQANAEAVRYDERQRIAAEAREAEQVRREYEEQAERNKKAQNYTLHAVKLGVKPEELQQAGGLVGSYLRSDIAEEVLGDDHGPLITIYLSVNPEAIDSLNNASMMSVGQIYSDIRSKAAALKPKQSNAPEPPELLNGRGAPKNDGGPTGATYE